MYIQRLSIVNLKSISHFDMQFEVGKEAGWHVILGDNGSGKSSVLRAISIALLGPKRTYGLNLVLHDWIRKDEKHADIALTLITTTGDRKISRGKIESKISISVQIATTSTSGTQAELFELEKGVKRGLTLPEKTVWANVGGWFSAAYGPFRRFTGGDETLAVNDGRSLAHLSVFSEQFALSKILSWIQALDYEKTKGDSTKVYPIDDVKEFINKSGLLPHGAVLSKINDKGQPVFEDGNGSQIDVLNMSDGYRTVLSLAFDLLKQMLSLQSPSQVFKKKDEQIKVIVKGVVMIDEVDAHLHPSWQATIGDWFTKFFPEIQFIVTTHSPLICRAALNGSIWTLPEPGDNIQQGGQVKGIDFDRLTKGNVLDAYGTDLFGENTTQSPKGLEIKKQLAELSRLAFKGQLSAEQNNQIEHLQSQMPTVNSLI